MKKVFIDPGHGGKDPGAADNGLLEKNLTLAIAKMVKQYLDSDYEGVSVQLSRSDDRFLELSERARLANKAGSDLFISIHINSSTSRTAAGFETFTYNGSRSSRTAAAQNVIHKAIMKQAPYFADRGQKKANYSVLRNTNMSAVLTESGFISSDKDAATLKDNQRLKNIALGHTKGIAEFLGLKAKPTSRPPTDEKLYRVQLDAFANKENAEALRDELIKKGYKPIIVES